MNWCSHRVPPSSWESTPSETEELSHSDPQDLHFLPFVSATEESTEHALDSIH